MRPNHAHARCHRAKLQNALLREVDKTRVNLSSKLVRIEKTPSGQVLLQFANGFEEEVDLLVGADGIRSVVRSAAFPDHRVSYTGKTSYRTLVKTEDVERIAGLPDAITFWHAPKGEWVYTANLNGNVYEITTLTKEPEDGKDRVSWGQDSSVQQMKDHFPVRLPSLLFLPHFYHRISRSISSTHADILSSNPGASCPPI